jgi:SSS family solute:Na+ symporter
MTDDQVARMAKILVLVISAITLYFAIYSSTTLVNLLLLGYSGVTQFFPGVIYGLYWRRVTMAGVFTGMVVGVAIVAYLMLNKMDPFMGLHAGFFALCVNFVITTVVSLLTPVRPNPFEEDSEGSAAQ